MIVVADTGPINYLVQLGHSDLLPTLYGRVLIPGAVVDELNDARAPALVSRWIAQPPSWLHIDNSDLVDETLSPRLGKGERQAILLAQLSNATLLLTDDLPARLAAERRQLQVEGTLAVLSAGAALQFLDLPLTIEKLLDLNFHATDVLIAAVLARARKPPTP